jgi:hypothetical protein
VSSSADRHTKEDQTTTSTLNWSGTVGDGWNTWASGTANSTAHSQVDVTYDDDQTTDDGETSGSDDPTMTSVSSSNQTTTENVSLRSTHLDQGISQTFDGSLATTSSISYTQQGVYTPTGTGSDDAASPDYTITEHEKDSSLSSISQTGSARRCWLHGKKRYLLQVAARNLGLIMRKLFGMGTPRGLQKEGDVTLPPYLYLYTVWGRAFAWIGLMIAPLASQNVVRPRPPKLSPATRIPIFSTGC